VLPDIALLGLVQNVSDVFARVTQMLQLRYEMLDGFFKEDVVFPEGVVRINQ
jgi:hypothetical protein